LETLVLHIGFRLAWYKHWEQTVTTNNYGIRYSLYVKDIAFRDFIDSFRNMGVAQAVVANINFQEELFNLV
jgi:hypothetical protein